ncbi:unnamed protein product [Spirodela intermedia]|uniref:ubiquitinyl hydrolase 1 n=1 Tax=Spirodela intermedia TaxID=51605 RepID=A0A7I8KY38_SPIIN|nr:unnamed protein product [Spirodela intermedia]
MLEPREADIPALFLFLVVLPLVTYILLGKWNEAAKRNARISMLARLAAEEAIRVEAMTSADVISMGPPMKNGLHQCARCCSPATTRCSRCKSVRYCSGKCQIIHWRQGHKQECQQQGGDAVNKCSSEALTTENMHPKALLEDNRNASFGSNDLDESIHKSDMSDGSAIGEHFLISTVERDTPERRFSSRQKWDASRNEGVSSFSYGETDARDASNVTPYSGTPQNESPGNEASRRVKVTMLLVVHYMLFPYEELVKFFQCEVCDVSPRGLLNCGNSCYANAVLQCLTSTKPLLIYLLRRMHSRNCTARDWCLMCELELHVSMLRESGGPLSPSRLLSNMRNIGCRIGGGTQEDAHEFLRLLVTSMQSICLEGLGGEKEVDIGLQETTLIQQMFGGRIRSKVKCLRCHLESERYENIMDLTLEIHGWVESLEDALTQFTAPEDLDGENMYRCGRCSTYVKARKQLSLHEVPNILTIVLKRFQTGKYGKINKYVTFPDLLDMIPFMTGTGDSPPLYLLYGVVVHLDTCNASFSGHYVSYVKDLQGSWFKIDDSEVQAVPFSQVMSEGAYMLFYMRSFPRPPSCYAGKPPAAHTPAPARHQKADSSSPRHGRSRQTAAAQPTVGGDPADGCTVRYAGGNSEPPGGALDFSDATSSDWSLFTSSDESSFTTESVSDSFSVADYSDTAALDPISSIFGYHLPDRAAAAASRSSGSSLSHASAASGSPSQTHFFRETRGFVVDSYGGGGGGGTAHKGRVPRTGGDCSISARYGNGNGGGGGGGGGGDTKQHRLVQRTGWADG